MKKKVKKDIKVSSKPKSTISKPKLKQKPKPIKTLADALNYLKVAKNDVARVHEFQNRFVIDLKVGGRQVVEKTK